jgi:hypothetical protein
MSRQKNRGADRREATQVYLGQAEIRRKKRRVEESRGEKRQTGMPYPSLPWQREREREREAETKIERKGE